MARTYNKRPSEFLNLKGMDAFLLDLVSLEKMIELERKSVPISTKDRILSKRSQYDYRRWLEMFRRR